MLRLVATTILWLLLCGTGSEAAFSRVQGSVSVSSFANTFGATVTSDNCVVGLFVYNNGGTGSVTGIADDKSNTYTFFSFQDAVQNLLVVTYILGNITNAPITVTATTTGTVNAPVQMMQEEYSGCAASANPSDGHTAQQQTNPGAGTDALTSGNITTTANGDLIWGVSMQTTSSSPPAVGTGFVSRQTQSFNLGVSDEDRTQSSAGTVAATFTSASGAVNQYDTAIVAIKAPASGGGSGILLLGR